MKKGPAPPGWSQREGKREGAAARAIGEEVPDMILTEAAPSGSNSKAGRLQIREEGPRALWVPKPFRSASSLPSPRKAKPMTGRFPPHRLVARRPALRQRDLHRRPFPENSQQGPQGGQPAAPQVDSRIEAPPHFQPAGFHDKTGNRSAESATSPRGGCPHFATPGSPPQKPVVTFKLLMNFGSNIYSAWIAIFRTG